MKILVTGSNGQLGTEILKRENKYSGWSFVYADLPELDITDPEQVIFDQAGTPTWAGDSDYRFLTGKRA